MHLIPPFLIHGYSLTIERKYDLFLAHFDGFPKQPLKVNERNMRIFLLILLLFLNGTTQAQEPITPAHLPIVIYQSNEDYDELKSNLEMAITGRGMLVMNVLHISNMLERTANDTGLG